MDQNVQTFNMDSNHYFKNRPRYPKELYQLIHKSSKDHQIAWDCACGNGQAAIDLVPYFSRIEATDINENQLKHSFQHEKISYSLQKSEKTNFPSRYFDAVCAAQCLHWFDLEEYFIEVKRVLKKQGLFACWGYSFFQIEDTLDAIIDSTLLKVIDPYWSENNRILHRRYADVRFPFKPIHGPEIRMTMNWDLNQFTSYLETWSAVKLYHERTSDSLIENVRQMLKKHWEEKEKKDIKMDFFYYLGMNE